MSWFRSLLILLGAAALGALLWQWLAADPGYLLIVLRGYSVESTVVVAVLGLLALWLLLRLLLALIRVPLRSWRRASRRRARERLGEGLLALHRGQLLRAEKLLQRAASDPELRVPALLGAADAASRRGAAEREAELLEQLHRAGAAADVAQWRAERLLRDGDAAAAVALLDVLDEDETTPRLRELRARALGAVGRAHEALPLLGELQREAPLPADALSALGRDLSAQSLLQAPDSDALARRWEGLSRAQRTTAEVVAAYAQRAAALGQEDAAAAALEYALRKHWDERLPASYAVLPRGHGGSRLKAAERWLQQHPNNPALLLALGHLCREERLWGKAEDYLYRAIAQDAGAPAWEELGHTLAAQGDEQRARLALGNALRVARGEDPQALPGRSLRERITDQAVSEERSPMGVPRLPPA